MIKVKTKTITTPDISLLPMEAVLVPSLPIGADWRYEPKWDGFRCLAVKQKTQVRLTSKSGKALNRYFPDIVAMLEEYGADQFMFDGELVIATAAGYSFADLQLRLHPAASRVARLSKDSPATLVVFDLLMDDKGKDLQTQAFATRRQKLEQLVGRYPGGEFLLLSPQTESLRQAKQWLKAYTQRIDGIIAKNITDLYRPGERLMQKYKVLKSADCVVGGFRYGANSKLVASLLLGLYDKAGKLHHVGYTSALKTLDKAALTSQLEQLISPPGFTGNAPGGPSRWTASRSAAWQPLRPVLVVEVQYDHVSDQRFRHGTRFLRWRPDKAPGQCTLEQLSS